MEISNQHNMDVDNFELIKSLLKFENEDEFYFLQILQRKKENPHISKNSKVIKEYYIDNLAYLESKYEEILELCYTFNARASIRLNRRSYEKCAFGLMSKIANKMSNKDFKMSKVYSSVCGSLCSEKDRTSIVDLDGEQVKLADNIRKFLKTCEPISENKEFSDKVIATIPSRNGLHLITRPFRVDKFKSAFPNIDIHKDNPTNLYIF